MQRAMGFSRRTSSQKRRLTPLVVATAQVAIAAIPFNAHAFEHLEFEARANAAAADCNAAELASVRAEVETAAFRAMQAAYAAVRAASTPEETLNAGNAEWINYQQLSSLSEALRNDARLNLGRCTNSDYVPAASRAVQLQSQSQLSIQNGESPPHTTERYFAAALSQRRVRNQSADLVSVADAAFLAYRPGGLIFCGSSVCGMTEPYWEFRLDGEPNRGAAPLERTADETEISLQLRSQFFRNSWLEFGIDLMQAHGRAARAGLPGQNFFFVSAPGAVTRLDTATGSRTIYNGLPFDTVDRQVGAIDQDSIGGSLRVGRSFDLGHFELDPYFLIGASAHSRQERYEVLGGGWVVGFSPTGAIRVLGRREARTLSWLAEFEGFTATTGIGLEVNRQIFSTGDVLFNLSSLTEIQLDYDTLQFNSDGYGGTFRGRERDLTFNYLITFGLEALLREQVSLEIFGSYEAGGFEPFLLFPQPTLSNSSSSAITLDGASRYATTYGLRISRRY